MLLEAVKMIGFGVGFFMITMVLGLLLVMVMTRSLPSKAKWDAAGPTG